VRTRGAVLREAPGEWEIVDIDVDEPRQGELGLAMVAAGLCHSDDHPLCQPRVRQLTGENH
jgi:Zn-dependent alcohol dehydrogenase